MSIKSISLINVSDKKTATGNKQAIATTSNYTKNTLIINHLHLNLPATTGKKPAKPATKMKTTKHTFTTPPISNTRQIIGNSGNHHLNQRTGNNMQ